MLFGFLLLVVAAVVYWCSGYSSTTVGKMVVGSVALFLAVWGVCSILSSPWFWTFVCIAVIYYVTKTVVNRKSGRR